MKACFVLGVVGYGEAISNDLDVVGDAGGEDVVVEEEVVAVERGAALARYGAVAEEGQAGGHVLGEHAEVLAGHDGVGFGVDPVGAQSGGGRSCGGGDAVGVVDGGGELVAVGELGGGAPGEVEVGV